MVVWWSVVICLLKYATTVMPPSYYFCISIAFTSKELVSLGSSVNCFGSKIIVVSILFASRKSCFCLSPQHHVTSFLVSHVINSTILAKFWMNFLKKTRKSQQLPHFLDGCQHPHLQHGFDLPSSRLHSLFANFSTEVLNLRLKERAFFQVEGESVRS